MKVFSLANEVFFDFRESFLREIRPKNYYSRKFLSKFSRFFDLAKVSAPKVISVLVVSAKFWICGEHLAIKLLWATTRILVTRVSLIYLVDEFFIFSLLVLLKEMRTRGESKISSCCFCVWCKLREFGARRSSRFPCVTPVVESFPSDFLQAILSYWAKSHLEYCQTSTMELFHENNQRL